MSSMGGGRGSHVAPGEELTLLMVGITAVGTVTGIVFSISTWHRVMDWLVAHHLLVTASESPVVVLPAAEGVGLDAPRLVVIGAALVAAIAAIASAVRRRLAVAEEMEQL